MHQTWGHHSLANITDGTNYIEELNLMRTWVGRSVDLPNCSSTVATTTLWLYPQTDPNNAGWMPPK